MSTLRGKPIKRFKWLLLFVAVATVLSGAIMFVNHNTKQTESVLNKQIRELENRTKIQHDQQLKNLEEKIRELDTKLQSKNAEKARIAAEQAAKPVMAATAPPITSDGTVNCKTGSGPAKAFIYQCESGNRPGAINSSSGACGLGQALPCSKLPCSLSDYACQDDWFTNKYMIPRYHTWENAKAFWLAHRWW